MLDETRASRVTPGDKIRGQAPSEGEFPGAWIWCLVNWVVPAEEGWWCHLMGIRRGDLRWLLLKEIWDDRLLLKAQQSQSTQCLPLIPLATSWDIYSSHNPIKTFPAQGWHQLARYAHCTRQIHQPRMFSCGLPACYTCLVIISCVNIHATCQKDLQSWKKQYLWGFHGCPVLRIFVLCVELHKLFICWSKAAKPPTYFFIAFCIPTFFQAVRDKCQKLILNKMWFLVGRITSYIWDEQS